MRDGLYRVEFAAQAGAGTGVVHLMGGQLWGGDSAMYYVGTYTVSANDFKAELQVDRHSDAGMVSVLGKDRSRLFVEGKVSGDIVEGKGTVPDAPHVQFNARLSRIAD